MDPNALATVIEPVPELDVNVNVWYVVGKLVLKTVMYDSCAVPLPQAGVLVGCNTVKLFPMSVVSIWARFAEYGPVGPEAPMAPVGPVGPATVLAAPVGP